MTPFIRTLLNDLYRADPSLQAREPELINLIETLMKAKPNAPINAKFKSQLRAEVLKKSVEPQPRTSGRMLFWTIPAAAFVVAAVILVSRYTPATPTPTQKVAVTTTSDGAFGSLSAITFDRNRAGGGTTEQTTTAAGDLSIMPTPAPDFTYTLYAYDGKLSIPNLPVLRRETAFNDSLNSLLANASVGALDLKKFSNLKVEQLTIAESADDGMMIYIDRTNGQISLTKKSNFNETRTLEIDARSGQPLPADDKLITAAKNFLSSYGMSTSELGEPVVRKDWLVAAAMEKSFAPSEIAVVFPWKINGQHVYDEGGQVYGLTVTVRTDLAVTGANNIVPLSFTASDYPVSNDEALIRSILRRGGIWYAEPPKDAKTQTVTLGAPSTGYALSRLTIDGKSREVYIPALVFPVNAADYAKASRSNVVIPVADELLKLNPAGAATSGSAGSIEPARASDLPVEDTQE